MSPLLALVQPKQLSNTSHQFLGYIFKQIENQIYQSIQVCHCGILYSLKCLPFETISAANKGIKSSVSRVVTLYAIAQKYFSRFEWFFVGGKKSDACSFWTRRVFLMAVNRQSWVLWSGSHSDASVFCVLFCVFPVFLLFFFYSVLFSFPASRSCWVMTANVLLSCCVVCVLRLIFFKGGAAS